MQVGAPRMGDPFVMKAEGDGFKEPPASTPQVNYSHKLEDKGTNK